MSLEPLVRRPVRTLLPNASCADGARLMRDENIGSVIVAKNGELLGVVTDRDLAIRVVAEDRDPGAVRLVEIMSPYPVFLSIHRSLDDAITLMRDLGVRRLPVVNDQGHLDGIVSLDDILALIGSQIGRLGEAVQREIGRPL